MAPHSFNMFQHVSTFASFASLHVSHLWKVPGDDLPTSESAPVQPAYPINKERINAGQLSMHKPSHDDYCSIAVTSFLLGNWRVLFMVKHPYSLSVQWVCFAADLNQAEKPSGNNRIRGIQEQENQPPKPSAKPLVWVMTKYTWIGKNPASLRILCRKPTQTTKDRPPNHQTNDPLKDLP